MRASPPGIWHHHDADSFRVEQRAYVEALEGFTYATMDDKNGSRESYVNASGINNSSDNVSSTSGSSTINNNNTDSCNVNSNYSEPIHKLIQQIENDSKDLTKCKSDTFLNHTISTLRESDSFVGALILFMRAKACQSNIEAALLWSSFAAELISHVAVRVRFMKLANVPFTETQMLLTQCEDTWLQLAERINYAGQRKLAVGFKTIAHFFSLIYLTSFSNLRLYDRFVL